MTSSINTPFGEATIDTALETMPLAKLVAWYGVCRAQNNEKSNKLYEVITRRLSASEIKTAALDNDYHGAYQVEQPNDKRPHDQSDSYNVMADAVCEIADAAREAFIKTGFDPGEWDSDNIVQDVKRGLVEAIDRLARSAIERTDDSDVVLIEMAHQLGAKDGDDIFDVLWKAIAEATRYRWLVKNWHSLAKQGVNDIAGQRASEQWSKGHPRGGPGYGKDYVSKFIGIAIDEVMNGRWFWCGIHKKAELQGTDTAECLLTGPYSSKELAEEHGCSDRKDDRG